MVHCTISNLHEELTMAYNLFIKMGALYVGAIALLTISATILA